ncbi:MAG: riboflavin synthase [Bacteroidales bacterium]|jgi:riboflavin synthase|nr:riboflavin synthase [Bacteroidales bacterium]
MFSGIVESMGEITKVTREGSNIHFTVKSDLTKELKIDQSMSHDGVCLTVVKVDKKNKEYVVTAIDETLNKTCLRNWKKGYQVNLERSMKADGRFDGHIVQGHVDQTATCIKVETFDGSWKYHFEYDPKLNNFTVTKGSISVNGVSLTVVDSKPGKFSVAIIPYTFDNTNFHNFKKGTVVNIEFDVLGKYMQRLMEQFYKPEKNTKKKK